MSSDTRLLLEKVRHLGEKKKSEESLVISLCLSGKWTGFWDNIMEKLRYPRAPDVLRDGILLVGLVSIDNDEKGQPIEVVLVTKGKDGKIEKMTPIKEVLHFKAIK